MLANGATLGYRKHTAGENSAAYTDLPGLKEIPEVGVELDKEENTCLTDPHKMYEEGIGDLPDMKYKWRYDNSKAGSPYRLMRDAADKKEIWDKIRFDEIYIGDDWKGNERWERTGKEMEALGARLVYLPYTKDTSSTMLREKLKEY